MDIHSFQPNLSSDLPVNPSAVKKSARSQSAEASEASRVAPQAGGLVKDLTAALKESPEVREEMVQKGKRLREDPNFPSADQWTALARAIVRDETIGADE